MARKKGTSKDDHPPEFDVECDPWAEVKEIYFKLAIDRGHGRQARGAAEVWTKNLISQICYKEKIGEHNVAKLVRRAIKKAKSGHIPQKRKQDTYWIKQFRERAKEDREAYQAGDEDAHKFHDAYSYLQEFADEGDDLESLVNTIFFRIRRGQATEREIQIAGTLREMIKTGAIKKREPRR